MKLKLYAGAGLIAVIVAVNAVALMPPIINESDLKIEWYGTLESGIAEAKRTGKPILLLAAAPQCLGVPGIW